MRKIIALTLAILLACLCVMPSVPLAYAASNEETIYNFFKNTMGVNTAAACGVLANIKAESNFDPTCSFLDTNGLVSYGICQWNGVRRTALENWCSNHGYSYSSLTGQLYYLKYELENSESSAWSKVKNVPNTADGAYTAGYNWAQYFERCSHYYQGVDQWATRANSSKNTYWPKYNVIVNYDISISGATSPGTITQGNVFYVRGTVTSGAPLTNVTSGVYDVNGAAKTEKSASPGTTSYDLANLDPYVYFNNLTPGVYRYKVTAANAQNSATLVDKVFVVLATADTISSGYYVIKYSANSSLAIDTEGHGKTTGTRLVLSNDNNCAYQQVYITSAGEGYYKIKHVESGLYFDVEGAASNDGTKIEIYPQNSSTAQLWQVLPAGNSYCFVPKCANGSVIDISGTAVSGAPTNLWTANLTNAQLFTLSAGCAHTYSYSVTTQPTTSAAGVLTGTCSKCGAKTTITLPKLTTTDYNYTVTKAATCAATGTGRYTWKTTTYGTFYFDVSISKTAHSYTSETIQATCVQHGGVKYTCKNCGYSYTDYSAVEYSEWSTTYPTGIDASLIESRTEYRYSDYETKTSYETSMSGWTQKSWEWKQSETGTINYVASWPSGFSTSHSLYSTYNKTPKTASESNTVKTVINSTGTLGYIYWHWCRDNQEAYLESMNRLIKPVYSSEFHGFHAFYSTKTPAQLIAEGARHDDSDNSYVYRNTDCCKDSEWYFPLAVSSQNYTIYKKLFTYERWTDWSAWSTTAYTTSGTRKVETRTVYRYVTSPLGEHQWNDGAVTTQPTCTEDGVKTFTCMACGATKSESVAALGHNYQALLTSPSCTEQGYTTHTCPRCGDSYVDSYTTALGHDVGSWTQTKTPSCTESGVEQRSCSRCEYFETRDVNPLGHDYQPVVTDPTCEEPGYTTYTCSHCGDNYVDNYVDAVGHYYENGYCVLCGAADLNPVDAELKISADHIIAAPGETIAVPVMISGGSDFAGFTLTVNSSEGLTLTKIEKGDLLKGADGMFTQNMAQRAVNWTSVEDISGEGELLVLTFDVSEAAAESSDLTIVIRLKDNKPSNFANSDEAPVSVRFEDIVITVQSLIPGDVNGDGDVDTLDSIRLVRYLVDMVDLTDQQKLAADVNHDNDITTTDAIRLVRYLVGFVDTLTANEASKREISHSYHVGVLTVPDVSGKKGELVTVPVSLSNNPGFAGFTFEVNYPHNLELVDITSGTLIKDTESGLFNCNIEKGLVNWTSSNNIAADGQLFNMTFRLLEDVADSIEISVETKDAKESNFANQNGGSILLNFFKDMPEYGNWAYDAITWAFISGITSGTSRTSFSPASGCSRSQVVTFLWRVSGSPEVEMDRNPFNDISDGDYYYKAVLWAAENGITKGTSATTFSPDATCTRAQIVTFLWRYEGEPASTTTVNPFTDVKPGAYYEKAVLWASETDVTAGTSATTFSPENTCTRAQVVTFLYRNQAK